MKQTFKQFLLEEAEKSPNFSQLKLLASKMKAKDYLEKHLNKLESLSKDLYAAGEISNPDFVELKAYAGHFTDKFFEEAGEKFFYSGEFKNLPEDLQNFNFDLPSNSSQIRSATKKLDKISAESKKSECYKYLKDHLTALSTIADVIDYAKAHVYKISDRRKEQKATDVEEKEKYLKPMLSTKSYTMMVDLIKKTSDGVKQELYKARLKDIEAIGDKVEKATKDGQVDLSKIWDFKTQVYERAISMKLCNYSRNKESLKSNWKAEAKDLAMKEAEDILAKFVSKSTEKLGTLVGRKNNLKTIKVIDAKATGGQVWCDLALAFEDASSFTVETKAVYSYSKYGKLFLRFPTTFHNVKLPDGSRMSNPSEERMDTVFTKA